MAFKLPEPTGEGTAAVSSGTSIEVPAPAGTQIGDFLLLGILVERASIVFTATGWTQIGVTTQQGTVCWAYFWRFATEAGAKKFKVSWPTSGTVAYSVTRIKKVNATTPVVGSVLTAGAASKTLKWNSITPTKKSTLDYLFYQPDNTITTTTPTGFTHDGTNTAQPFYREYTKEEATGETTTAQNVSEAFVTCRIALLGLSNALSLTLEDSVAISDSVAKATGKAMAESVGISDAVAKAIGRPAADAVAISDAVAKTIGKARSDQVEVSDSIAKKVGRSFADAVAIADAIARRVGKAIADAIGITDLLEAHTKRLPKIDEPTGLVLWSGASIELRARAGRITLAAGESDLELDPGARVAVASGAGVVLDDRNTALALDDRDAKVNIDG